MFKWNRWPSSTRELPSWFNVVVAVVVPVAIVVSLVPVRDRVENTNVALSLVVLVLLGALIGGRSMAIVTSISATVAFDYFFTRPYNSLRITGPDDIWTAVLLVIIGLIAGDLVERVRRNSAKAAATQSELASVYQRAELAAGADDAGALLNIATQELTRMLDLKSCRYLPGPLPMSMPELRHNAVRVPSNVDPAAHGLVGVPVRTHGRLQGHLVLAFPFDTAGLSMTAEQRHAAVALADQVGVGLLRFRDQ